MEKMRKMNFMFILTMVSIFLINLTMVIAGETIDIVTFNDFHGNVAEDTRDWGKNLGMSKMVAKINDMRKNNPNTIVVSGGDNYQGTAISNLTYGAPVSNMMKALGVTASAVGNHEFDWGRDYIAKWAKDGNFDYLAANIYDTKTNKPVKWAKPYKIIEKAGIKIALIGLAHPDTVTLTKVENVTGLEFRDPVKVAQEWINFLKAGKAKEGTPDVIIAVTHLDSQQDSKTKEIKGTAVTLAEGVTGLDAIVSAHSHRTVSGKVNGVAIVQAYKYGRALGLISIKVDDNGKVSEINESVNNVYKIKNDIIPDSTAEVALDEYKAKLNPILNEIVGVAEGEFTHSRKEDNVSVLGEWVCEVMAEKAGTEIAIQNGGGLRRSLYAGNITMGDLYEVMPYDNQLVKMKLSGKDIRAAIDHGILNPSITDGSFSGLKVLFDRDAEFENRILAITLKDGTPLENDKYYSVVVNDFMYGGGDKYDFSNAKDVIDTFVPIRTVLIDAIKKTGKIVPKKVDVIAEAKSYIIAAGDVLGKIAKEHNVTVKEIVGFNNIENSDLIFAGEKILLPVE
ncbi:MAG: multifunctional 2',3'-cyclic-nucleotide 2'-phosphodiesterase/5'-nucleotidase/3'-nucleotidase [Fusobacteriia bacterium 4572_132]|nr:MAG: multifunctional 2',3'-cyclic-nucleotide 2'-phosphodiesterase/5'-nucleotidase/3'-nucleotidase [Fusobacteriia bacterium 4572_132]